MAVDVQGSQVVAPYVNKFAVTFPVAVDTADVFGRAFGLKAIPETFLVDEVGIIRLRGRGPGRPLLEQVEQVLKEPLSTVRAETQPLPMTQPAAELERRVRAEPSDWQARLALARHYDAAGRFPEALGQLEAAREIEPREASIPFLWGLVLLHQGQKEQALEWLRQARDLDPENWRIRKQIWAIEHLDKFYAGDSPDFDWQKEQLSREKEEPKR